MKVILPYTVSDAALLSSNIPENDYPVWNAATPYSIGDRVIRTTSTTHAIYERIVAGTTPTAPESDTTYWVFVSSTNRWKMFDSKGGTQTVGASGITVSVNFTQVVNSIAFFNVNASSIQVIVTDTVEGVVYNQTFGMTDTLGITNMYRYFFTPTSNKPKLVITDLPNYANTTIQIIVTNTGGSAAVGSCIIGQITELGGTQYGASVGIQSYSVKTRDGFGNISIISRPFTDKGRFGIKFNPNEFDRMKRFLSGIRDTPTVFIGSEDFSETSIYGFYKDFDLIMSSIAYFDCSIEIEGLV